MEAEEELSDDVEVDELSIWGAIRYVLRIRTNVILIISSALGYYMFAGIRTFGVEYADEHYGLSQGLASGLVFIIGAGAVLGVLASGRISDHLLDNGHLNARITVPAVAFVLTTVTFAPAIVFRSLFLVIPLLIGAGFFLAAANPPLDAARLDVVPGQLWGRAEAARTVIRTGLEALAPLLFGLLADEVFGGRGDSGLEATFLVMTVPLLASGLVLLLARSSYLTDVATARRASRT